jgi:hypothetical protein
MKAGAYLSPLSDTSKTPLDMARGSNQDEIAKTLLEAGAKAASEVLTSSATRGIQPIDPWELGLNNNSDDSDGGEDEDSAEDDPESHAVSDEEIEDDPNFLDIATAIINSLEEKTALSARKKKEVLEFLLRDVTNIYGDLEFGDAPTEEEKNLWPVMVAHMKADPKIVQLLSVQD